MIFTGQVKFFTGQKNQSQVFWTILSTLQLVDNYLDDIWFLADTQEKNILQLMVAEY